MAPAEWICSTEGIKDELILLVVGSRIIRNRRLLGPHASLCSFAISNIIKRRWFYQRIYLEQRRRYVIGKLTGNLTDEGFKIAGELLSLSRRSILNWQGNYTKLIN
jgi:hypothetical protein